VPDDRGDGPDRDATAPEGHTRRDVLDLAIAGTTVLLGGTTVYPIARYLDAPTPTDAAAMEVVVGKAGEVAPGTAAAFKFGSKPGLLACGENGKMRAFLAICPHLSCVVQFRADIGHIWCACHNGHFDLTGRNIDGPPPAPLEELTVELRGDDIVVRRG
jgi:cytochrome b6-f complex iron-sulfur subunit